MHLVRHRINRCAPPVPNYFMTITHSSVISQILDIAKPVLTITTVGGRTWYRKPKNARRGPWLSATYNVIDQALWSRKGPCIYFLIDGDRRLRYVGISLNKLDDRWRTSPAYTEDDVRLQGDELFHSQCWHRLAAANGERTSPPYTVLVLSGREVLDLLPALDHEISSLAVLRGDPDIIVTVLELWICKYGHATLWNKALTGGKNPRAERDDA